MASVHYEDKHPLWGQNNVLYNVKNPLGEKTYSTVASVHYEDKHQLWGQTYSTMASVHYEDKHPLWGQK